MKEALLRRPWLFIIAGYLLGVAGLATMITISIRHRDQPLPVSALQRPH